MRYVALFLLLLLPIASAAESVVYSPKEIRGSLKPIYSLQHKHRYGDCHFEYGKGEVCRWGNETLPYYQEFLISTSLGPLRVRNKAYSVTPEAPRGSTYTPDYITNKK